MASFVVDYKEGKQEENNILPIIRKHFNKDIKPTTKSNHTFDFFDEDGCFYELKKRNNRYNLFPTTIIGINKISTKKLILLFSFSDGLYYIKYNKKLFDTFERKLFVRNKRIDFTDKLKEYLFIPISHLTFLDNSV